jgi:hypothetical protein
MNEILGNAKTIRQLLGNAKYAIDYFQREYRWKTKHVSELLTDLTAKFHDSYDPAHARHALYRSLVEQIWDPLDWNNRPSPERRPRCCECGVETAFLDTSSWLTAKS